MDEAVLWPLITYDAATQVSTITEEGKEFIK